MKIMKKAGGSRTVIINLASTTRSAAITSMVIMMMVMPVIVPVTVHRAAAHEDATCWAKLR